MKKLLSLLILAMMVFSALSLPAAAKEVVIYENDFSSPSLSDFTLRGNWSVADGRLTLPAGKSSSGCVTYKIPSQYLDRRYKIEVDYLGHTGMGGLLIGASGKGLTETPSYFFGYNATTTANGEKGLLANFKSDGTWDKNLRTGLDKITDADLHITVVVNPATKTFVFTITSLDGARELFGMTYTMQTVDDEKIYDSFSGIVGIRRAYTCAGTFDNFRITSYEDDVIPALNGSLSLGSVDIAASDGIVRSGEVITGSGTFLSKITTADDYRVYADVLCRGRSLFYFGMRDEKNGLALEIDRDAETVVLYKITDGKFEWQGERRTPVADDFRTVSANITNGVVSVYFDSYLEGAGAYPLIELAVPGAGGGRFGFMLSGGEVRYLTVTEGRAEYDATYTNPVITGADPDILFHEGKYYLYNNQVASGNDRYFVYTSDDLVRWSAPKCVYTWKAEYEGMRSGMSPNVFYYDGVFYLLYSMGLVSGDASTVRIFYASSDSPEGPFVGQTMLHDVHEIGGHPYVDDDGRVYISLSRFDFGSNLYLEELSVKDGVITPLPETLTMVAYPTESYEINGRGRTCEGGVIYKHGGYYYMIYAPGSYKLHYGEAYGVSENVLGPYEKYEYDPFLTYNAALDGAGDAIIIPSPDGSELFLVYHRHNKVGTVVPRMTCIDRIKFVKNPDGGPDILTVYGPTSTPQPLPAGAAGTPAVTTAAAEETTAPFSGDGTIIVAAATIAIAFALIVILKKSRMHKA